MRLRHLTLLLLLVGLLVSCGKGASSTAQALPTPPTGNGIPQMGIVYTTPTSPPAISKEQAIQVALHSMFANGAGINSSTPTYARYVILHQQNATVNGQPAPSFPAWVITFEGVSVSGHGKHGNSNHELYIVVNAQTGKVMFSFSYR